LILSKCQPKSRTICYTKENLKCKKINFDELELIKIETKDYDVYGVYRPFKLKPIESHSNYMTSLINQIKASRRESKNLIICGDFNLDFRKKDNPQYHHSKLYEKWLDFTNSENLVQNIQTATWGRFMNNNLKESILDHFYTTHDIRVEMQVEQTPMSDHTIIIANLNESERNKNSSKQTIITRKWTGYSPEKLKNELRKINWTQTSNMNVQDHADFLAQNINFSLNNIAPEVKIKIKEMKYNWSIELLKIKRARENLWRKYKKTGGVTITPGLKNLEKTFKDTHKRLEKERVRNQSIREWTNDVSNKSRPISGL